MPGIALLHRAIDLGYDHFDTARLYGHGHNETLVGQALKGKRDKVFLASKMGIFASGDKRGIDCHPDTIRAELEKSLTLLQTDHIDLYYMHRRDFTVPIEDSVGAMADLIQEGKIGAIGLSEMSADTLRRAAAVHPIAAMQTEYSPWTRQAEIAVIEACRDLGTTFVAFSPVARGALANGVRDPQALEEGDIRKAMPASWPTTGRAISRSSMPSTPLPRAKASPRRSSRWPGCWARANISSPSPAPARSPILKRTSPAGTGRFPPASPPRSTR
jgi:aryl-alcohol dehydrogenase-like predicted oxidoreductase